MSKILAFAVFCLENYKAAHKMRGRDVDRLFREYRVYDYLEEFYDVLHTTGYSYIVDDIDIYIQSCKAI